MRNPKPERLVIAAWTRPYLSLQTQKAPEGLADLCDNKISKFTEKPKVYPNSWSN